MTDQITYAVSDGVARIELNRPEAANAFDMPTATLFGELIEKAAADDAVRAVLLTGAGKRFCAGGDVASMVQAENQADYLKELAVTLDAATQALAALEKPVVVAVQGAVAGAGLSVMLSGDIIIAAPGTKFVIAYPGVGLVPDVGASWLLPRAIGQQRALHLALTNTPIDAEKALDWGLVTEVGEAARAEELATTLAAGPVFALGQARRLIRHSWETDRAGAGIDEAETIHRAVQTEDAQRLLEAFAKR
ncbi:enoyl-CoA hydratase/isomerase family protein [Nocardioides sp. AE5]|uniref:enoyl-CoA hydratase/isomerase family protein n=1 Tax=Nocardioides sp. AE5 TaxID=2962573 RepID=UPI002880E3BA|nr:enoyl-CoA hydratase/isomerase family protein [Nocardioides sp. AE5]MDT0203231.1 enoyl-CoA hydratase/isomerase family protein [Nocardioides sp. AE5]